MGREAVRGPLAAVYFWAMARSSPRSSALLFGFLALYILLQSVWWMWLLLSKDKDVHALQQQLVANGMVAHLPVRLPEHGLMMVLGEGLVFLILIVLALWITYRTMRHEISLARQQRDFLLATSHELRTPIAALKLHLQTLQRPEVDKGQREMLTGRAKHDVDRLHALTEKILLASRLEENAVPPNWVDLDIAEETAEIIAGAQGSYGREHRITADLPKPCVLRTDAVAYRSIVENLLENACKYSRKDGPVKVELARVGTEVHLRVIDSGPGVAAADRHRIFEKFFRGGNEETRDTKGTGLGLFIVRRLMETLGGRAEFRPTVPHGSTFTAIFPSHR
jgi:signal transduction histidine kinase